MGFLEWGSGVSFRRSLKVNLPLTSAVVDIWGFLLMNPIGFSMVSAKPQISTRYDYRFRERRKEMAEPHGARDY